MQSTLTLFTVFHPFHLPPTDTLLWTGPFLPSCFSFFKKCTLVIQGGFALVFSHMYILSLIRLVPFITYSFLPCSPIIQLSVISYTFAQMQYISILLTVYHSLFLPASPQSPQTCICDEMVNVWGSKFNGFSGWENAFLLLSGNLFIWGTFYQRLCKVAPHLSFINLNSRLRSVIFLEGKFSKYF
jgi:hypothetical protein